MSYPITTTAGVTLATIADGTVNSTATSLTLIGKNYAGYGNFLNENWVKLLENFNNTSAPSNALTGQLWFDKNSSVLKVYNGTTWKPISSSSIGTSGPASAVTGDLWWDTTNKQLNVYNGSGWTIIGPTYTASTGTSGTIVDGNLLDSGGNSHVVVKFYVANSVVAILSKDSAFTPQTSIAGFTTIYPGLNLVSASTIPNSQFTGPVSNALTLQGVSASQFLRTDQDASTAYKISAGGGFVAGGDLTINTTAGATVDLINQTNGKDLNLWVTKANVQTKSISISASTGSIAINSVIINSANVIPNLNNTVDLGSATLGFKDIYAAGNLYGTAITAQYADLAERFEADATYAPGTVVEIGGLKEITAAVKDLSDKVFGVISTAAGFLMNGAAGTNDTHPPVAVNGRVPVRVTGQIRKGDRLVSAGNGLARAGGKNEITAFNVIGRSLEDKLTDGEGTVESIVKLNS